MWTMSCSLSRRDITERKQTEDELRESARFLSNILASIQDGISILDKDMRILMVNHTMKQWYAHAMPLMGKKCYEAYHGSNERCDSCPTYETHHDRRTSQQSCSPDTDRKEH